MTDAPREQSIAELLCALEQLVERRGRDALPTKLMREILLAKIAGLAALSAPLSQPESREIDEEALKRLTERGAVAWHGHPTEAAVQVPQAPLPTLPHPGSPEVSAMLDSLLAEYNWPSNTKNAARAGFEAARRMLTAEAPNEQKAPLSLNAAIEYMISENNRLHDELVAAKAAPSPVAPEPLMHGWVSVAHVSRRHNFLTGESRFVIDVVHGVDLEHFAHKTLYAHP